VSQPSPEQPGPSGELDHTERNVTFPSYVDRWREARNITWELETRERIESNVRVHLKPPSRGCSARSRKLRCCSG